MNNSQRPAQRRRNPQPRGSYTSNFTIICVLIIAVLVILNVNIFKGIITENPTTLTVINREDDPEAVAAKQEQERIQRDLKTNFDTITVTADDAKSGNLVLVNNYNAFSFESSPKVVVKEELVTFSGRQSDVYTVSYPAREMLTPTAMEAFNQMAEAFAAETGHKDLFMLDSYRSYEDQQRVYESKGSDIAAVAGNSEHHTGLAFDLELYIGGRAQDFDGTGDYAWIHENAHKFGYILRYPRDKTDITEFSYEPWHFRYVGKEHANYMYKNNLCLEEYIRALSRYAADGERLQIETDDGEKYTVYSAAVSGDSARIYVPKKHAYTVSGDNCGRVIVSYKVS